MSPRTPLDMFLGVDLEAGGCMTSVFSSYLQSIGRNASGDMFFVSSSMAAANFSLGLLTALWNGDSAVFSSSASHSVLLTL